MRMSMRMISRVMECEVEDEPPGLNKWIKYVRERSGEKSDVKGYSVEKDDVK